MITLERISDITSCEYAFAEELLTTAFPRDEYRDLPEQRHNTTADPRFHLMIARDNDTLIGFISYWELGEYCYVEHFATLPSMRSKGYGKAILDNLRKVAPRIVLEAEEPVDEITARRVEFYRRNGFAACPLPYKQPPYRSGDNTLPMRLLFYGCPADEANFICAKEIIYSEIYNYKE